jgi:hypothetical protein
MADQASHGALLRRSLLTTLKVVVACVVLYGAGRLFGWVFDAVVPGL